MRSVYRRLFRLRVRHAYYAGGETQDDFVVEPTPSTRDMLEALALRTRRHGDGLTVFGEVVPDSTPSVLLRPLGSAPLRLVFELRAVNPLAANFTALPRYRPARDVFCFDNLRLDVAGGRNHLGDVRAGARLGSPVELATRAMYDYRFGVPVNEGVITLQDRFGNAAGAIASRLPSGETARVHRIDLASIGLRAGRYTLSDNQGGLREIYFDPELEASRPLALVEIFNRTDGLTPDNTDRVPGAYRFVSGEELTGLDAYYLQFEARATTWRYNVIQKYAGNGVDLARLSITSPFAFDRMEAPGRVTFTSGAAVALSDTPRGLKLRQGSKELRALPDPGAATPLAAGAAPGSFVSDLFVYV